MFSKTLSKVFGKNDEYRTRNSNEIGDLEEDEVVLLELPIRTQISSSNDKEGENGRSGRVGPRGTPLRVGPSSWWRSSRNSYSRHPDNGFGKRVNSALDAWTALLVILVLTLVMINDMNTYGKVSPRWAHPDPAIAKNISNLIREVEVLPTMTVAVFYEALCPDSRHFVMKQLTPAFNKLKDIIDLSLVPYGKASTMERKGKYTFDCQHGEVECQANMVHACVTNIVKDQTKQLAIVHCMIDKNMHPFAIGQKCVEKHKEKWGDVEKCVKSEKGPSILKHMGDMTHSLKPKVRFIPTITIDGSQDDQNHILQDFHKVLCRRYKGPKQDSC